MSAAGSTSTPITDCFAIVGVRGRLQARVRRSAMSRKRQRQRVPGFEGETRLRRSVVERTGFPSTATITSPACTFPSAGRSGKTATTSAPFSLHVDGVTELLQRDRRSDVLRACHLVEADPPTAASLTPFGLTSRAGNQRRAAAQAREEPLEQRRLSLDDVDEVDAVAFRRRASALRRSRAAPPGGPCPGAGDSRSTGRARARRR